MGIQDIHKEILELCIDDGVGFWLILKRISKDTYALDSVPEWAHQKTVAVIKDLMQSGLIEAGNFVSDDSGSFKFEPILLSVDEVITYIEQEWDKLGKSPNIGDVCWFKLTLSGKQLANELGLRAA